MWARGLRDFFEYRELGIQAATGGQFKAHVLRVKRRNREGRRAGFTPLVCLLPGFQMICILKGGSGLFIIQRKMEKRAWKSIYLGPATAAPTARHSAQRA